MVKETINKMNRQFMEWEKIFASDATNKRFKRLISKNMQPSHITQHQKNEELNHKMGRRTK